MKNSKLFLSLALCIGLLSFSSCSKDDDNSSEKKQDPPVTNLQTPTYESVSAKYNVTDASSDYQSIELTASGNYIITKKTVAGARLATRSDEIANVLFGKFTKVNDKEFNLEGFGTLKIEGSSSEAEITITIGDSSVSVTANRTTTIDPSVYTNQLCRTWSFAKIHLYMQSPDNEWEDEYTSVSELKKDYKTYIEKAGINPDKIEEPKQLIFTKSGTYFIVTDKSQLELRNWKWVNEQKGILSYTIGDGTKTLEVSWYGNQLVAKAVITQTMDNRTYTIELTYYLNEVK